MMRGGGGLFYDRPDGNTVFSIPGNPPIATASDLRNGLLQNAGQGQQPDPAGAAAQHLPVLREGADVSPVENRRPDVAAVGRVGDMSYVGNHGINRLGAIQNGSTVEPERGRHRRGLPAAEPGPDARLEHLPGANAYTTNLLRAFKGLGTINENTTTFWDTYHSLQTSLNRRFRAGSPSA